jgi:DNA-directed RNA polymerase sigma subunit (sigma70/sigma32)
VSPEAHTANSPVPETEQAVTRRAAIAIPIARNLLYYNQPSLEENPPTIEIINVKTIAVNGIRRVLSAHERAIFNSLASHRDGVVRSSIIIDEGYPTSGSIQSTRSALSSSIKDFRDKLVQDGRPLFVTHGVRGGARHEFDHNLLITDRRGFKKPTQPKPKRQAPSVRKIRAKARRNVVRDYTKPFVDIEKAKGIVPEVFSDKYDNAVDRELVKDMVKLTKANPAIIQRVNQVFGTGLRAGIEHTVTDDPFSDLMNKAKMYRLLTVDEEAKLSIAIKAGVLAYKRLDTAEDNTKRMLMDLMTEGSYAYEAFFHANLRLIVADTNANAPHYPHLEKIDIADMAYLGLQRAIEKFDHTKGFKFSTYAKVWIRQAIQRGLDEEARIIRLPSHISSKVRRLQRTRRELTQTLEGDPTDEELIEATGLTAEDLETDRKYGQTAMASLNKVVGEDGETELGDLLPDEIQHGDAWLEEFSDREEVKAIFKTSGLTLFDKYLLSFRFGVKVEELKGTTLHRGTYTLDYDEVIESILAARSDKNDVKIGRLLDVNRNSIPIMLERAMNKVRLEYALDEAA